MSNPSTRSRQAGGAAQKTTAQPKPAPPRAPVDETARAPSRPARPASPPRALESLDEPFAYDVADAEGAGPLHGKVHPRSEISDAVPTLDDEVRRYHHHPNDAGCIEFEVNPDAADAAADLASDLGSEFLEGATRGQDLSDVVMSRDENDGELPYLLDEDLEAARPPEDDEEPQTAGRARRRAAR